MKKKAKKSLDLKKVSIYNLSNVTGGNGENAPNTGFRCMDASTPTYCYVITKPVTTTVVNEL